MTRLGLAERFVLAAPVADAAIAEEPSCTADRSRSRTWHSCTSRTDCTPTAVDHAPGIIGLDCFSAVLRRQEAIRGTAG
jgi:hypothetical protein